VQAQNSAEALFAKIKEVVNSGVYRAEDALHRLLGLLTGGWEDGKSKANENIRDAGDAVDATYGNAKSEWEEIKRKSGDTYDTAAGWIDKEKEKVGKQKVQGEL
jgi:hypothetical protein